jgi:esterase/lipase superfamily enzyme
MRKTSMKSAWLVVGILAAWNAHAQVPIGTVPLSNGPTSDLVVVPFVTVRAVEQDRKERRYFGSERGAASAGECMVSLDARKKRQTLAVRQRAFDETLNHFAETGGHVTVYVHGYNVSFEQSCREAAALQERVGLQDKLLLFSWPSNGKFASYLSDVGDIEWSVPLLQDLILTIVDRFGAQNIDVIGHSLGAKAVVDAMRLLEDVRGEIGVLGRMILIAPDLDGDIFLRNFTDLSEAVSVTTVYVSPQDRALKASRKVRSEPRLGEGSVDLSQIDGIDVVEVSQRRWRFSSRHLYHLEDDKVAEDLGAVLSGPPRPTGSRTIFSGRK